MNTIETIQARRAVKQYDATHRMTKEEEHALLALAMLSPTAFNIQHWRFVVVSDPLLRKQIRQAAWDQAQMTDASLLIVLCADLNAWQKQPERYWMNAAPAVQNYLMPLIDQYYRDKPAVQRDEAMRSCGIAAQTLMLAAKAMGYDSCPMDGFDFEQVAKLIRLPEDHLIAMCIAVGKAVQPANPRGGQLSYADVVIHDQFKE